MASGKENYVRFDELEKLPRLNRENYLFEHQYLVRNIPQGASVIQVGSMDGMRAIRLAADRPDLRIVGLEIESELVELALRNVQAEGLNIEFLVGDIVDPPKTLAPADACICLNNTLGFIRKYNAALASIQSLGTHALVSVFGETFQDELARTYYAGIGMTVSKIDDDKIYTTGGDTLRRFRRQEVRSWGKILAETPLGYLVAL